MKDVLDELIVHFKSQSNLAAALGVSVPAVSQWMANGFIPAKRAVHIERLTGGKFKAIDLSSEDNHDA